jgi:hypothetical protein
VPEAAIVNAMAAHAKARRRRMVPPWGWWR